MRNNFLPEYTSNVQLWCVDRGYTGVYANGDGDKGIAECPFDFYHQWVTNPQAAQAMSESVTRSTIGVKSCPVVSYVFVVEEEYCECASWCQDQIIMMCSFHLDLIGWPCTSMAYLYQVQKQLWWTKVQTTLQKNFPVFWTTFLVAYVSGPNQNTPN